MFLKKDCILLPESFGNRAIGISADMASTVCVICHSLEKKAGVSNENCYKCPFLYQIVSGLIF